MRLRLSFCLSALCALAAAAALAESPPSSARADGANTLRDGARDFDFEVGAWKTQLKRRLHPLSGSNEWVEYTGTSVVRKVWDGRANLVELDVSGAAGRIEGAAWRLYNPEAKQWSLNFANSRTGILTPPVIGEFKNGRGEFYGAEYQRGFRAF